MCATAALNDILLIESTRGRYGSHPRRRSLRQGNPGKLVYISHARHLHYGLGHNCQSVHKALSDRCCGTRCPCSYGTWVRRTGLAPYLLGTGRSCHRRSNQNPVTPMQSNVEDDLQARERVPGRFRPWGELWPGRSCLHYLCGGTPTRLHWLAVVRLHRLVERAAPRWFWARSVYGCKGKSPQMIFVRPEISHS